MAYVCQLTDGVETIDLYYSTAGGFSLLDEGIKPGRPEARALYGGLVEDQLVRYLEGKRTIPLELYAEGTDHNDLINKINDLERLIRKGREYRLLDLGNELFLEFQIGAATHKTRFGVISGEVDIDRLMSLFCKDEPVIDSVPVVLTCKAYWESSETFNLSNELDNPSFEWWNAGGLDEQPDGWSDLENITAGAGTNDRAASPNIKHGQFSCKTTVSNLNNGDYKGISQDILSRLTPGTTYMLGVWVRNNATTNGKVRLRAIGDNSGASYAFDAATENDPFALKTVTFTPNVSDTYLKIECFIEATANGCSGWMYVDKLLVMEGTSMPDAYMTSSHIKQAFDTTAGNIMHVTVTEVPGEMPVPVKVIIENTYNVNRLYVVYIAQRTRETVCQEQEQSTLKPILEGEDADYSSGASQAGSYSGGYIENWASLTHADWTTIARWHINPADVKEWGGYWKVVGVAGSGDWSPGRFRIKTTFESLTDYEVGKPASSTTALCNLGNFLIPPLPMDAEKPEVFRLELQFKGSGSSLALDYLMLLPLDGFQILRFKGYGLPYQYFLLTDAMRAQVWAENTGGEEFHMVSHAGEFVYLKHRDEQRFFFLAEDNFGGVAIARTLKVSFKYRLRGVHLRGTE